MKPCKNLSNEEIEKLSIPLDKFFHFFQSFGDLKVKYFLNIWMFEDRILKTETVTCGIFLLYFYENLFNPNKNSKIQNNKKLTKRQLKRY